MPPTPEDFAHSRLIAFAAYQWPGYQPAKHHRLIARHLEAVERGDITRLMIFMPPRAGKSLLVSEFFPAWYLGRNPAHYVIAATYAQDLADEFGRKVRNQIADDSFRGVFPGVALQGDSQSAKRFHLRAAGQGATELSGAYFATGVGGPMTGKGGHLLLLDDLTKNREEAESATYRQRNKDWYTSTAYTRLMPGGKIVLVTTRWHSDDLAGWLLREHGHENWTVLSLPAVAEAEDEIGRKPGDALWPEAFPVDVLAKIKESIGSRDWSALYQQRPTPAEGGIFKAGWFPRYDAPLPQYRRIVQSWDTAYKPGEENDPSACLTLGEHDNGYDLLHALAERMEYPDLKARLYRHAADWGANAVLIEDKASGQSLIQDARRETQLPVIPIRIHANSGDKTTRAMAVSPTCEAGRVRLPRHAAWLADFEAELMLFPNAVHDDMCFVAGTLIATQRGNVPIEAVTLSDQVFTPHGWRKVTAAGQTGEHEVIERFGLVGTPNHPIYTLDKGYQRMDTLTQESLVSRLTLCDLIRLALPSSSSSTASPTAGWAAGVCTTSRNRPPTPGGRIRRAYTSPFGSTIRGGRFRRATKSITKTGTRLTVILATWSAYRLLCIRVCPNGSTGRNSCATWSGYARKRSNGTGPKKGAPGTANTPRTRSTSTTSVTTSGARTAAPGSRPSCRPPATARINAARSTAGSTKIAILGKQPVYNLTVESASCYYANGVLVHNCDALSQALNWFRLGANPDRPMIRRL